MNDFLKLYLNIIIYYLSIIPSSPLSFFYPLCSFLIINICTYFSPTITCSIIPHHLHLSQRISTSLTFINKETSVDEQPVPVLVSGVEDESGGELILQEGQSHYLLNVMRSRRETRR